MSKPILILGIAAMLVHGSPNGGGNALANNQNIENISHDIMSTRFVAIEELTALLKKENVSYTLSSIVDPAFVVNPKTCHIPPGDSFAFFMLRLEVPGTKLFRYRLYQFSHSLCIEEDFSYKNPYQS